MTPLITAPFVQLPIVVNSSKLLKEIQILEKSHWQSHHFDTLQSIPLVDMDPFEPFWYDASYHLPYLMSFLCSWEAPIGKSRISILKPTAAVQEHVDVDYYWKYRLRVHIVVKSNSKAMFGCDNQTLQLPEGQVWVSNNWAPHWIANNGDSDRIHIVIDTVGSPKLWHLISKGWHSNSSKPMPTNEQLKFVQSNPDVHSRPNLEQYSTLKVRHPAEVETILNDTIAELTCSYKEPYRDAFQQLMKEWRTLFFCHQHSQRHAYNTLLQQMLSQLPVGYLQNGLTVHTVLQTQIGDSLRPTPKIEPLLFVCPSSLENIGHRLLNICIQNMDKDSSLTTESISFRSVWKDTIEPHPIITQHIREQWVKKLAFCLYNPDTKIFWADESLQTIKSKRLWVHNSTVLPENLHTWRALFPTVKVLFLLPSDAYSTDTISTPFEDVKHLYATYHQQVLDWIKVTPDDSSLVLTGNHSSLVKQHTLSAIDKLNHWLGSTLSFDTLFSQMNIPSSRFNDLEEVFLQIYKTLPSISEDDLG